MWISKIKEFIKITETFKYNHFYFIDWEKVHSFATARVEYHKNFNEGFNIIVFFLQLLMEGNQRFRWKNRPDLFPISVHGNKQGNLHAFALLQSAKET